jgi:hypothetical protein
MRKRAKAEGKVIKLSPSRFMGGTNIFRLPKGVTLPKYVEPCDKLPNGDEVYQKYNVGWMMEISAVCCC